MRRGGQSRQILRNDAGELVAINLGFDFCCEHECGTKGFYNKLGITGPTAAIQGVRSRRIQEWDNDLLIIKEYKNDTVMLWGGYLSYAYTEEQRMDRLKDIPRELEAPKWSKAAEEDKEWSSAWSSGPGSVDFGLRFRKDADGVIYELKEALERKDVSVWINSGGDLFGNRGGLVLAITSKIPESVDEAITKADLDYLSLTKAADKTKIKIKLDKARAAKVNSSGRSSFGYYALSPSWMNSNKSSKHPVMFWLNPMDQESTNYGWFTVEELEQWIKGEGPIPKSPEKRKRKEVRF